MENSASAGYEGRDDVAGVAVQIVASPVVSGGRPGIGVPGGDLDIPERHPGIEGGRNEAVTEAVGGDVLGDPGPFGQASDDPGGGVTVEPVAAHPLSCRWSPLS